MILRCDDLDCDVCEFKISSAECKERFHETTGKHQFEYYNEIGAPWLHDYEDRGAIAIFVKDSIWVANDMFEEKVPQEAFKGAAMDALKNLTWCAESLCFALVMGASHGTRVYDKGIVNSRKFRHNFSKAARKSSFLRGFPAAAIVGDLLKAAIMVGENSWTDEVYAELGVHLKDAKAQEEKGLINFLLGIIVGQLETWKAADFKGSTFGMRTLKQETCNGKV